MQVNVFISKTVSGDPPILLVLPFGPLVAIPSHLRDIEWRHLAVTMSDDRLLGASAETVEYAMERNGYALVLPRPTSGPSI